VIRFDASTLRSRVAICAALVAFAWSGGVEAQELEPRSYSNAPIGMNFLLAGYAYTTGGVSTDPALPLENARVRTHGAFVGYSRVLDIGGMSSKIAALVPFGWASGSADFAGQPYSRSVAGLADPAFRFTVNFYGAPALTLPELRNWEQDLIIGATMTVSAPLGRYEGDKLLNIGTHRWAFKPELGISQAFGRFTFEIAPAITFYTANHDFFGGHTRKQAPIASAQGHVIYQLGKGFWVALDGTYYGGGRTTIDGETNDDLQSNSRAGVTAALPLSLQNSVKVHASTGVSTRTGRNFQAIGVVWQFRFGGGL
jgi:hypothetical protein